MLIVTLNLLPYLATAWLFWRAKNSGSRRRFLGALGFLLTGLLLMSLIHLFWFFDIDGFQSGSSTSGLVLFFGPIWSMVVGLLVCVAIFLFSSEGNESGGT